MCLTRSTPVVSHAQTPPWLQIGHDRPALLSTLPPLPLSSEALSSKGTGDLWTYTALLLQTKVFVRTACGLRIRPGTLSGSISNRRQ